MKYKLIETYPNSPQLGFIFDENENPNPICNDTIIFSIQNYPKFWEEVYESNFEILEFKDCNNGDTFKLNNNKCYSRSPNNSYVSLHNMLHVGRCVDDKSFIITKIKRLSDGEIFTIGNKIKLNENWEDDCVLDKIYCEDEYLTFQLKQGPSITSYREKIFEDEFKNWEKVDVFKTFDGEEFTYGDRVWWVTKNGEINNTIWKKFNGIHPDCTNFLSKEKCESYIKEKQKEQERKDIRETFDKLLEQIKKTQNNTTVKIIHTPTTGTDFNLNFEH